MHTPAADTGDRIPIEATAWGSALAELFRGGQPGSQNPKRITQSNTAVSFSRMPFQSSTPMKAGAVNANAAESRSPAPTMRRFWLSPSGRAARDRRSHITRRAAIQVTDAKAIAVV